MAVKIDQIGTTNHVTKQGWYGANPRAQVQGLHTSDGLKIDSQVAQLVSAMATYSAANAGFNPTSASVHSVPNDCLSSEFDSGGLAQLKHVKIVGALRAVDSRNVGHGT